MNKSKEKFDLGYEAIFGNVKNPVVKFKDPDRWMDAPQRGAQ